MTILVEVRLHRVKWLIVVCYNPHKKNIEYFFKKLSTVLGTYCTDYEKFHFLGDFNSEITENRMTDFCVSYNLKSLLSLPTFFKITENPTFIDLILTSKTRCFNNSLIIETGLSGFHKLVITELYTTYKKSKPKFITYREYKRYNNLSLIVNTSLLHTENIKDTIIYL